MKTTPANILVWVLLLACTLSTAASTRMTLADAVSRNKIRCSLRSINTLPDSLRYQGGHGLELLIFSQSDEPLELALEPGQRFRSEDSTMQNLMILDTRMISLRPNEKKTAILNGYCINNSRSSPDGNRYRIGKMATGILLKVAQFLGNKKVYGGCAQAAVWAITDGKSIENVSGSTNYQTRQVRSFLYEVTGRPRPPRSLEPLSYPNVALNGQIRWEQNAPQRISIAVLDSTQTPVAWLIKDRSYTSGRQFYEFLYSGEALIPGTTYRIRVLAEGQVLQEIVLKSKEEKAGLI